MVKLGHLISIFIVVTTMTFSLFLANAQTSTATYNGIKANPSTIRWCVVEAGDDPAHIIGNSCKVYRDCLSMSGLDENVDHIPFPSLTTEQIGSVRKCHQALFNDARVNPQLKGSGATQQWLQHLVISGTEAKSFPVPTVLGEPR